MKTSSLKNLRAELLKNADFNKAAFLKRFFKTGKGQYGEGDVFLGITVPKQRKIAKKYLDLSLQDLSSLIKSKVHEERLTALFVAVYKYKKFQIKKEIYQWYIKNDKQVNNWDLVDSSAPYIVGDFLKDKDRSILFKLAKSKNLWEKRIAILSTFAFINQGEFKDTFKIAEILLSDTHDLIHKAVGWMLREVGKRVSQKTEEVFLQKYYQKMPRTMLRYAIERFPEKLRQKYLK
jgi:3-methyladenine DNA glycosylase AlkD